MARASCEMTKEELELIQAACRDWLQQPGATSRITIPAAGPLSRPVEVERSGILTFDNVLITSAVDTETGVCYTKLFEQPDGVSEFFDTPFEKLEPGSTPIDDSQLAPMRATQKRYHDAMQRLAEEGSGTDRDAQAIDLTQPWIEKENLDADEQPKYQLYTNGKLLGYSLLERAGSNGQRSGRFHPSENYFDYFQVFAALPQAENEYFEANAREGYGIIETGDDELRKTFNELSAAAGTLKLYLEDEAGHRIKTSEVRLEDLSRHYDDETERWLHVAIDPA